MSKLCGNQSCTAKFGCHYVVMNKKKTAILDYPVQTLQEAQAQIEFANADPKKCVIVHNMNTIRWN